MNYKKVVVLIFVMLLVGSTGCISSHSPPIEKQELKEVMGGRYNGSLWLYTHGDYETTCIHFTVDEKTYVGYRWNKSYIPALDWLKNNTPKDAKFLCWWDYGGMIRGYTERGCCVCSIKEVEESCSRMGRGRLGREETTTF